METIDYKKFRNELMVPINRKLSELFDLIDYETRFQLRLSSHAIERLFERIKRREDALRLGKLFDRIISHGVCELLYFQSRYANGDKIGQVEFTYDEIVVPITFVSDYVVLRTIFIDNGEGSRDDKIQIDLSESRFR